MSTRIRTILAVSALVVTSGLSACGVSGGSEAGSPVEPTTALSPSTTTAPSGDTGSTTVPTKAPTGGVVDYSDELPVRTTYGYLDFELTKAVVTETADATWGVTADEGDVYAVVDLGLTNPTEDATFTVDPRITHLEVDGEEYDALVTKAAEVEPGKTVDTRFVYGVPAGTELDDATVVVQEAKGSQEDERIPAFLPIDGTEQPAPTVKTLAFSPGRFSHSTYCYNNGVVTVDSITLSENMGTAKNGTTLGVVGGLDYKIGLGRARVGRRFLTVSVNNRITTEGDELGVGGCLTQIGPGAITTETADGTPIEGVVSYSKDTSGGWPKEPNETSTVLLVPDDLSTFKVNFAGGTLNGDHLAQVVTATAK